MQKGSRSHHAQDAGLPKLSKRLKREQCVLEALLRSVVACTYDPEVMAQTTAVPKKLKSLNLSEIFPERD